ncbi:unnamed protein product [Somion occarium]|uniref:Chromo domain-containing protein n=1 Tax=Somion occarium TaxID=3059160 RepID=A0ABP1CUN3_9APHY
MASVSSKIWRNNATNTPPAFACFSSCTNPSLAEPGRFFVDHIIGRKPHCGNSGSFLWLVKWEGYPIADASWQTQADFPRSEYYTCAFDERARREGHDVSEYNSNILLREARDAGWR